MAMLGRKTLLVNPPLVNGVALTRQGRCQEREEVLGTTKPPYTLALIASLFRAAGLDVRLVDLTATRQSVGDLAAQLDREGFHPTLILYPSTTPTLDADTHEMTLAAFFFDVLHVDGEDVIDRPLRERAPILLELVGDWRIPAVQTEDAAVAEAFLTDALATGHEGVMVKSLAATY